MAKRFLDKETERDIPHFLYYMVPRVKEPDRVKIGVTTNVEKRRQALSASCGQEMVCVWALYIAQRDWAFSMEKEVHELFKKHRLHGEWFRFHPHVVEFPDYLAKEEGIGEGYEPFRQCMRSDLLERSQNEMV